MNWNSNFSLDFAILLFMRYEASNVGQYLEQLPDDRKEALERILGLLDKNLPKGFEQQLSYSFPSFVIPHSLYPDGYHCNPEEPLPFISVASQKHSINLYHMGIYADEELYKWFVSEYPKHVKTKLDMGKSCIRFKKPDQIPYDLLAELFTKMTPQQWIQIYEKNLKR